MKTERRHELQTNELSQQIDELMSFARTHGRQIGLAVVAVAAVVAGASWFVNSRRATLHKGWEDLYSRTAVTSNDPREWASYYREIQQRGVSKLLSGGALMQAADRLAVAALEPGKSASDRQAFAKDAEGLCQQVVSECGDVPALTARAKLMLGMLAEQRGDSATARQEYESVAKDSRFARFPSQAEATARLKQMADWQSPVEFAPPLPPPPPPTTASASQPSGGALVPTMTAPLAPAVSAPPATTQPAS
ncbi:MAG: hypothetical protein U1A27_12525 [Phycisphaerae bacterium]